MFHARLLSYVTLSLLFVAGADAGEANRYPDAKHGKGELKHINGLPVLTLEGTPEEIGQQMAALTVKHADRLLNYPKEFLKRNRQENQWNVLVTVARSMAARFPDDYKRELDAAVKAAGVDRDLAVVGNTMFDIKKIAGCSTLVIEPDRSATGGTLFGRNLDFPTLGYLQDYSLVIICKPNDKHAFVSIGFPGLVGCLSGMNDAGLALATLEVYESKDDSVMFDPQGIPYAMCYRRLLEECTTVDQAAELLRSMKRTTRMNLAIADKKGGAVLEITPKNVIIRHAVDGLCPCTNHFRSPELAVDMKCRRFDALLKAKGIAKIDVADVAKHLNDANQGEYTLQTMVFEPETLKLHLSLGPCPSSGQKLVLIDVGAMLR